MSWSKLETVESWQNNVMTLTISNNRLLAGHNNGMHVSDDSGKTWINVLSERSVSRIEKYGDILYACGGQLDILQGTSKCLIFRSLDNGNSWEENNNELIQVPSNRLYVYNGNIFLNVDLKVFRAELNVDNWSAVQWIDESPLHGFHSKVSGLVVFNGKLYASTSANGLYVTDLDDLTSVDEKKN